MPFSLTVGENTVPAGNLSFASLGMSVEVPSGYVRQKGNTAIVHAKPGAIVQLSVNGQNVGESVTTNSNGKATVGFDLPEGLADSLLYGDRVKVNATATSEGATLSSYADCTYRPQAQIWSFKVTNEGQTQSHHRWQGKRQMPDRPSPACPEVVRLLDVRRYRKER